MNINLSATIEAIKSFIMGLLSNDPNSPSSSKFVFLLSGVIGNVVMWGTWAWLNVAHFMNTARDEVLTMIGIPEGVWVAYGISMGIPLLGPTATKIFAPPQQVPPATTPAGGTSVGTAKVEVKKEDKAEP